MSLQAALREFFGGDPTPADVERLMAHHIGREPMQPLGSPCHDCAVTCGFYEVYAEALLRLSLDRRAFHLSRWFCHNNPTRACAGALRHCATPPAQETSDG